MSQKIIIRVFETLFCFLKSVCFFVFWTLYIILAVLRLKKKFRKRLYPEIKVTYVSFEYMKKIYLMLIEFSDLYECICKSVHTCVMYALLVNVLMSCVGKQKLTYFSSLVPEICKSDVFA